MVYMPPLKILVQVMGSLAMVILCTLTVPLVISTTDL